METSNAYMEATQNADQEQNDLSIINDALDGLKTDFQLLGQTNQELMCPKCNKAIERTAKRLKAKHKVFHEECFTCVKCNKGFGISTPFVEHNNDFYCETCHKREFAFKCAACDDYIYGKVLKAMDKAWHVEHFTCTKCRSPFNENGYLVHEDHPYCLKDYKELFLPKCASCHLPIENNYITALERQWHDNCFACTACKLKLDSNFYIYENNPYCKRHFHEKNGSLCFVCSDPIEGPCISLQNTKKAHTDCFKCPTCGKNIDASFYEVDGKFYCMTDGPKAAVNRIK